MYECVCFCGCIFWFAIQVSTVAKRLSHSDALRMTSKIPFKLNFLHAKKTYFIMMINFCQKRNSLRFVT